MIRTFFLTILISLFSIVAPAQEGSGYGGAHSLTLHRLGLKNKALEIILSDIDAFIGNKANGLQFPVSKIVFSQVEDLVCYEIVGIDNSWKNLFQFGEVPYGYIIIHNRLYIVAASGYHDINLNPLFYATEKVKTFNKSNNMPSPGIDKNPIWFFEYRDSQSYLISTSDLDVLD